MTTETKLKLFTQVRYDLTMALRWADDMAHGGVPITPAQASELLRRCRVADASSQAYERAMQGVEPPKVG